MKTITIGKMRCLQQIASRRGTFTVLALDHRQNLRKANPAFTDDGELSRFKLDVVAGLAPLATAVLLDPEVSAAQAIAAGVMPGSQGLVVALEATGYDGPATARSGKVIPGWSVEKAKRMGASAIKLLVYYHPDSPTAGDAERFVAGVAEDCRKSDIPLMIEPLSYSPVDNSKLSSDEKLRVVVETAARMTRLGIDVLKAEFPLDIHDMDESRWKSACQEVTKASQVPWILLSAAVDYETYTRQVVAACEAGASGIAVGRAVWQEAVALGDAERLAFLRETAADRMARLTALCGALARPFTDFYSSQAPFDWYKSY